MARVAADGRLVVRDRPFEGATERDDQRLVVVEQAPRSLRAEAQALVERVMALRVAGLDHWPQRGVEFLDGREAGRRRQVVRAHEALDVAPLGEQRFAELARRVDAVRDPALVERRLLAEPLDHRHGLGRLAGRQQGRHEILDDRHVVGHGGRGLARDRDGLRHNDPIRAGGWRANSRAAAPGRASR